MPYGLQSLAVCVAARCFWSGCCAHSRVCSRPSFAFDDSLFLLQSRASVFQLQSDSEARSEGVGRFPFDFLGTRKAYQAFPAGEFPLGEPSRQPMANHGDAQYVAHFGMGKKTLAGILDTGSNELVVFGSNCGNCGVAAHYNPHSSKTYARGMLKAQHSYSGGDLSSTEAHDVVSIGSYPSMNQTFWTVEQAQMPMLNNAAFEAIVGLGPPETSAADAWTTAAALIENASAFADKGDLPPIQMREQVTSSLKIADELSTHPPILASFGISTFSVCLGMEPRSDGYITWNDHAHLKFPELFSKVPVVGQHTWSVKLTNARLVPTSTHDEWEVYPGCAGGCSAILDTATSLLSVPSFVMKSLRKVMDRRRWTCSSLSELPSLSFQLGELQLSLPPEAYVAQVKNDVPPYLSEFLNISRISKADMSSSSSASDSRGSHAVDGATTNTEPKCELVVLESSASTSGGPLWILGVPFFRQYYTTFNVGQLEGQERDIYVAPASKGCRPAQESEKMESALRTIDMNKVYLPEIAQRAALQTFVDI